MRKDETDGIATGEETRCNIQLHVSTCRAIEKVAEKQNITFNDAANSIASETADSRLARLAKKICQSGGVTRDGNNVAQ